jgi:hypothetical protein
VSDSALQPRAQTESCPRCGKLLLGAAVTVERGRRFIRYRHRDGTECLFELSPATFD